VGPADPVAELVTRLVTRLPPPPEPPGDPWLSAAAWVALTAVGVGLLAYSLLDNPAAARYAALIAALEFAIGYGWVVALAGRRDWKEGLFTALPPVALDRLLRPQTSRGYRPLGFVLAGVTLFALVLLAPAVRPHVRAAAGLNHPPPSAPADPSPADRLRAARDDLHRIDELRDLTERVDALRTRTRPAEQAELVGELRGLLKADVPEVRAAALTALVAWAGDDARPDVLAALTGPTDRERAAALAAYRRWPDPAVVKAVAARLADPEDRWEAFKTLREIGRAGGREVVEDALLPLLSTRDDLLRAVVRELTERHVGGERTVAELKRLETAAGADAVRMYRQWWQAVARSRGPGG
jgi:hypothetical protein